MMEYTYHTYAAIVKKIVGDIQPAGASRIDEKRFENLKEMCKLVNELVSEIDKVACEKDRQEHSIKEMGKYAHKFLTKELGIVE